MPLIEDNKSRPSSIALGHYLCTALKYVSEETPSILELVIFHVGERMLLDEQLAAFQQFAEAFLEAAKGKEAAIKAHISTVHAEEV